MKSLIALSAIRIEIFDSIKTVWIQLCDTIKYSLEFNSLITLLGTD